MVDAGNIRVEAFSKTGQFISQFPCASGACTSSGTPGQLWYPTWIAVDPSGNLWVNDAYVWRIEKFSSSGSYLGVSLGAHGNGSGQYLSVAVDASGNIWAADSNSQIQEFDNNGNWKATLCNNYFGSSPPTCSATTTGQTGYVGGGGGMAFDHQGNLWVNNSYTDAGNNGHYYVDEFNAGTFTFKQRIGPTFTGGFGQFWSIGNGIAVDAGNNIWTVDGISRTLIEFNNAGSYITQYGYFNTAALGIPEFPAFDSSGNLWLGDIYYNYVVKMNPTTGTVLNIVGTQGTGPGQFATGYQPIVPAFPPTGISR